MGFIDDKNKIVQQVSLFEVLGNLPKNAKTSSIESVRSSSKNLLPFMLDLLTITCKENNKESNIKDRAKCDLIRLVSEILIEFFPVFMKILKEAIIKGIKASIICPTDFKIPQNLPTITLRSNEFDLNKITVLETDVFPYSLLFGDPNKDLNVLLANLVQTGVGSVGNWNDLLDIEVIEYIDSNVTNNTDIGLNIKINSNYAGKSFDDFLKDFLNNLELFNKNNFIPNLMEVFNGTITNLINEVPNDLKINNLEQSIDKETVNMLTEKILDSDPCDESITNDSFFTFDSDELLNIQVNAQNKMLGGTILNYECVPTFIKFSDSLTENSFNELKESLELNPNASKEIINTFLTNNLDGTNIETSGDDNLKKALSFKLALSVPKMAANLIYSPKIMVLNQISKKIVINKIDSPSTNIDLVKGSKVFFEYLVRESSAALLEIIYDNIKETILRVVREFISSLIKESIDKKIKQLKSLTNGFVANSGISAIVNPELKI